MQNLFHHCNIHNRIFNKFKTKQAVTIHKCPGCTLFCSRDFTLQKELNSFDRGGQIFCANKWIKFSDKPLQLLKKAKTLGKI
jgi:hypothetical protein